MSSTKDWDWDNGVGVPGSGFREIKQGLCCSSGSERNDFKKIRHKVVVVVKNTGAGPAGDTEWGAVGRWQFSFLPMLLSFQALDPLLDLFFFLSFLRIYLSTLHPSVRKSKRLEFFFSRKICSSLWLCLHYYPWQRPQERTLFANEERLRSSELSHVYDPQNCRLENRTKGGIWLDGLPWEFSEVVNTKALTQSLLPLVTAWSRLSVLITCLATVTKDPTDTT